MAHTLQCRVLNAGAARGVVIRLDAPLSFWGGYDPSNGTVIDQRHPQAGVTVAGQVIVLPSSRGSAGTPAGVAESLRAGHGPSAIVIASDDVNIAIGAMVADKLYASSTPVVAIDLGDLESLHSGQNVSIDALASGRGEIVIHTVQ